MRFDPKSRDDIPRILKGLQHLYTDLPLRSAIFQLLESQIAPKVDKDNGRPGMALWTILVCGVIRLDLNGDYGRLHELVNQHLNIRQMLGHGTFDREEYHFQTLKDNVSLLTPELLDQINLLVVNAGHGLVKKKRTAQRCVGGAAPLWLKPMFTSRPTSTCCSMRCARSSASRPNGAAAAT